jgi:hypothetical protein
MNISYAIPVCNEYTEIKRLITHLQKIINKGDEIVVLYDSTNGTEEVKKYLDSQKGINVFENKFRGHFAEMKNILTQKCTKDFIFQIDADEMIDEKFPEHLPSILANNPEIEVFKVSRINTVEGLTMEHIKKWNWNVNGEGHINFPDWQYRIYKNNKKIVWKNKVHEVLVNYEMYGEMPCTYATCLTHEKTIERQEKQNDYYDTL